MTKTFKVLNKLKIMIDKNKMTYFGFRRIEKNKKNIMVNKVFHDVAKRYDIMNDIMSFGLHRIWKNITVNCSGILNGQKVLDVAGGTGDLTKKFSYLVGSKGKVVLLDSNRSMIKIGRDKIRNEGLNNVHFVQANAENIPFINNYFNCVSISFGLRNITNQKKALSSMLRVLKPGGNILILEFSKPSCFFLNKVYDIYSFYFLPIIGALVANNTKSYKYLAESIRMHPNQEQLKKIMKQVGFKNVTYHNLTGGIVSIHNGFKF